MDLVDQKGRNTTLQTCSQSREVKSPVVTHSLMAPLSKRCRHYTLLHASQTGQASEDSVAQAQCASPSVGLLALYNNTCETDSASARCIAIDTQHSRLCWLQQSTGSSLRINLHAPCFPQHTRRRTASCLPDGSSLRREAQCSDVSVQEMELRRRRQSDTAPCSSISSCTPWVDSRHDLASKYAGARRANSV